jgi:hypothetical protein
MKRTINTRKHSGCYLNWQIPIRREKIINGTMHANCNPSGGSFPWYRYLKPTTINMTTKPTTVTGSAYHSACMLSFLSPVADPLLQPAALLCRRPRLSISVCLFVPLAGRKHCHLPSQHSTIHYRGHILAPKTARTSSYCLVSENAPRTVAGFAGLPHPQTFDKRSASVNTCFSCCSPSAPIEIACVCRFAP